MDENSELERLRARVAELEAEPTSAGDGAARPAGHAGWRAPVSAIMIILACVLAPLSVASVWTNAMISDTNRYVTTVAPVIDSPAVQSALTTQVTAAVMDNLDVQTLTAQTLQTIAKQPNVPPRVAASLPALTVPLVNGIEGFTRTQVAKVLASPQFARVWDQVNRVAHAQVVKLLEGNQGGAVDRPGRHGHAQPRPGRRRGEGATGQPGFRPGRQHPGRQPFLRPRRLQQHLPGADLLPAPQHPGRVAADRHPAAPGRRRRHGA